jgi:hypothetical protein
MKDVAWYNMKERGKTEEDMNQMKDWFRLLIHNYGSSDTATAFRGSLQNLAKYL